MPRAVLAIFLVLAFSLAQASCTEEMRHSFAGLVSLHAALQQEYETDDIQLDIENSQTLTVSFVNSRFNALAQRELYDLAVEVASFSWQHFPDQHSLQTIAVSFIHFKKLFFVIDFTRTLATHAFSKEELIRMQELSSRSILQGDDRYAERQWSLPLT